MKPKRYSDIGAPETVLPAPFVRVSDTQIWRLDKVRAEVGLTKSGIYRSMNVDGFPTPIRLGSRAVGWKATEVIAWIQSRPRALSGSRGTPP